MLNVKQKKILYQLSKDARISATQLAKKAAVSKDIAHYTINKFLQQKLISRLITLINTESLGYTRYEIYIKLKNSQFGQDELVNHLMHHPFCIWAISSLGNWDLLTEFYAKDVSDYEKIITELKNKFFLQIKELDSVIVSNEFSFPLKSIGYNDEEFLERKKNIEIKIDKTDLLILKELSQNARVPALSIAKKISLSLDAVIYRIKKMVESKLILGYRIVINEQFLDLQKYKLLLKLNSIKEGNFAKILTYLKGQKSTYFIKKCIGQWDLSITLLAHNPNELKDIAANIRDYLGEALDDYYILLLFDEYKNDYFPKGIYEKS